MATGRNNEVLSELHTSTPVTSDQLLRVVHGRSFCDTRAVSVPYESQSEMARIVFFVSAGAFLLGELVQAVRGRREATRDNLRAEVVFRAVFFIAILLFPIGRAVVAGAVIGGGVWLFAVGAVITWFGLLLRWWSFAALGRYFTVVVKTSQDQPILDSGPYRLLRHPSYTGLLLVFAGGGLMWGNWVSTVAAVGVLAIVLIRRLLAEEHALEAATGDRYREFEAHRTRLIPYVW
jgi:protein-S-isoprenylcysteine O-methyltransferase Ste14